MICSSTNIVCRLAISLIDIVSSQRQANQSVSPVCREDLVDADRSSYKLHRGSLAMAPLETGNHGATDIPFGDRPTGMFLSTLSDFTSITETVFA